MAMNAAGFQPGPSGEIGGSRVLAAPGGSNTDALFLQPARRAAGSARGGVSARLGSERGADAAWPAGRDRRVAPARPSAGVGARGPASNRLSSNPSSSTWGTSVSQLSRVSSDLNGAAAQAELVPRATDTGASGVLHEGPTTAVETNDEGAKLGALPHRNTLRVAGASLAWTVVQIVAVLAVIAAGTWFTLTQSNAAHEATRAAAEAEAMVLWRRAVEARLDAHVRAPIVSALHDVLAMKHYVRALPPSARSRCDMPGLAPILDVALKNDAAGPSGVRQPGVFAAGYVRHLSSDAERVRCQGELSQAYGRAVHVHDPSPDHNVTLTLTHARPASVSRLLLGFSYQQFGMDLLQSFTRSVHVGGIATSGVLKLGLGDLDGTGVLPLVDGAVLFHAPVYDPSNATWENINDVTEPHPETFVDPPTLEARRASVHGTPFVFMSCDLVFEEVMRQVVVDLSTTVVVHDITSDLSDGSMLMSQRNSMSLQAGRWAQWHSTAMTADEKARMGCGGGGLVWARFAGTGSGAKGSAMPPEQVKQACERYESAPSGLSLRRVLDVGGRLWVMHLGGDRHNATAARVAAALTADDAPARILITGLSTTGLLALSIAIALYASKIQKDRVKGDAIARAAEAARMAHEETMSYACHELRNPLHAVLATADFVARDLDEMSREVDALGAAATVADASRQRRSGVGAEASTSAGGGNSTPGTAQAGLPAMRKAVTALLSDVRTIVRSSQVMQNVVDDLLDYAKLRRGQLDINAAPTVIRDLLDEVLAAHTAFASVPLSCEVSPWVPAVIHVDELRVRQVVANGLSNACKLTRAGRIVVRASVTTDSEGRNPVAPSTSRTSDAAALDGSDTAISSVHPRDDDASGSDTDLVDGMVGVRVGVKPEQQAAPSFGAAPVVSRQGSSADDTRAASVVDRGAFVLFEVLDTGPGLGGNDSLALFQPFEQGALARRARRHEEARRDRAKAGTGLGLAICYHLATLMGGHIGLEDLAEAGADSSTAAPKAAASAGSVAARAPGGRGSPHPTVVSVCAAAAGSSVSGASTPSPPADGSGRPGHATRPPHHGARFWFTVPLSEVTSGADADDAPNAVPTHVDDADDKLSDASDGRGATGVGHRRLSGASGSHRDSHSDAGPFGIATTGVAPITARHTGGLGPRLPALDTAPHGGGHGSRSLLASSPLSLTGVGSVVSPASVASRGSTNTRRTRGGADSEAESARRVVGGSHWLVVDDERINRRLAARFLDVLGCTCTPLEDGDLLEPYLRLHHPWALAPKGAAAGTQGGLYADEARGEVPCRGILLDIEMARSRGDAVCAHLRSLGLRLPVLACTGNASPQDTATFTRDKGMTMVLTKPYNRNTMGAALVAATRMVGMRLDSRDDVSADAPAHE